MFAVALLVFVAWSTEVEAFPVAGETVALGEPPRRAVWGEFRRQWVSGGHTVFGASFTYSSNVREPMLVSNETN